MGDSTYARAKHVQMVDKDPNKAIALYWAAINNRDRVDSALKDMAVAMRQVNRAAEAIEAIKTFRGFCSEDAQEPLDNLLLDLYKNCGRIDDYVGLLKFKLKLMDERLDFGGRATKLARFQGRKKCRVSINLQKSRLLGALAWAYVQSEKYEEAEPLYREALAIEPDYNKQCNLALCLMKTGKLSEAKSLLQLVPSPSRNFNAECYLKSFNRASKLLNELEFQSNPDGKNEEIKIEPQRVAFLPGSPDSISNNFLSPSPSKFFTPQSNFKTPAWGRSDLQRMECPVMGKIPFHSRKNDGSLMSSFVAAVTESLNQNEPPQVEKEKEERKAIGAPILKNGRRSWADAVEEEEEELANLKLSNGETVLFGDENVNSNILPSNSQCKKWKSENRSEKLSKRIDLVDSSGGSEECRARTLMRGSSARRYLSFNERIGIWS